MREEYLSAVQARLEQVSAARAPGPVLSPDALAEARQLADVLRDDDGDLQVRYVLGWFHFYRFQALPEGQDSQDLTTALQMFTPCFVGDVDGLPELLVPLLAQLAADTATDMLQRAIGSADLRLISATVTLWRRILDAVPESHASRARYLTNLAVALRTRFERTGTVADLDAAIDAVRTAVQAAGAEHPERAKMLSELGAALRSRSARTGESADLDAAIAAPRAAVAATLADAPYRGAHLNNLGNALRSRFDNTGMLPDLEEGLRSSRPRRTPLLSATLTGLCACPISR